MIFILILTISFFLTILTMYILQFYFDLGGDSSNIIEDGLVKELFTKASNEQIPIQLGYDEITIGRFSIRKSDSLMWFPYYVYKNALPYLERQIDDDWGDNIGYVRWLSNDWRFIRNLIKEKKKEQSNKKKKDQRKQLLLDK